MRKTRKWLIISAVLALCISVCACLFAGCIDTPDNTITYTVNVQTDTEAPASGVKVQLRKGNASIGDAATTGADGKAVFQAAPDDYTVRLTAPLPYAVPQDANLTLTEANPTLTVKLEKVFVYTVNLVQPNGDPFYANGVSVGICDDNGTCLTPVEIGANGVAMIKADPANYHVQVLGLPATSKIKTTKINDVDYYADDNFTAQKNEMDITVYSATVLTDLTPMSDAEKLAAFPYDTAAQQRTAYKTSVELAAGEVAYFAIKPEIEGEYTISYNYAVSFLSDGTEMTLGKEGGYLSTTLNCNPAYDYYYFKAVNNTEEAATAEVAVAVPYSTYLTQSGKGADTTVTVGKANTNAIIAFSPTEAGTYTISATGAQVIVSASNKTQSEVIATAPADSDYTNNPSTTHLVYTSKVGATVYIAVTAKAASYPTTVGVKIEKTGGVTDTSSTASVEETLTTYTKPADKELIGVAMDGTATLVYNETDKFYHLGTADGPVVVVNITGELEEERYWADDEVATLATLDGLTGINGMYIITTQTEVGEDTVDYQTFLRGFTFDDYEVRQQGWKTVYVAPTTIAETSYAAHVNEDGVYPLTQELKVFLEKFYAANKETIDYATLAEDAWLFACYYYGEPSEEEPTVDDVIVGEYKFVKMTDNEGATIQVGDEKSSYNMMTGQMETREIGDNEYQLVVTKNGTFAINIFNVDWEEYDEEKSGTWQKSESGVYSFTIPNGMLNPDDTMSDLVYTITFDDAAGTIKLEASTGETWEFVRATQA